MGLVRVRAPSHVIDASATSELIKPRGERLIGLPRSCNAAFRKLAGVKATTGTARGRFTIVGPVKNQHVPRGFGLVLGEK